VKVGHAYAVAEAIEQIDKVDKVLVVTGPYDIVALANLPAKSDYKPFINAIHEIDGIVRTETCLAI
jgi:DNA-binding Lrp family transcriptional regulator